MQEQEEDLLLELGVGKRLIAVFITSHLIHAWYLLFKEYF